MKFILWILNVTQRHRLDINRYEKSKKGRIISIFVSLFMVAFALGSTYLFMRVFLYWDGEEFGMQVLKFIGSLVLMIAGVGCAVDYCGCFSYVGFRTAAFGAVNMASRVNKKKSNATNTEDCAEAEDSSATPTATEYVDCRGLDIFVGVFNLILALAVIGLTVFIIVNSIHTAIK